MICEKWEGRMLLEPEIREAADDCRIVREGDALIIDANVRPGTPARLADKGDTLISDGASLTALRT